METDLSFMCLNQCLSNSTLSDSSQGLASFLKVENFKQDKVFQRGGGGAGNCEVAKWGNIGSSKTFI